MLLSSLYMAHFFTLEIDECAINPCQTGACMDFVNGYVCDCTNQSFVGRNCSLDSSANPSPDYCSADFDSCLNGATCVNNVGGNTLFNCTCSDGYLGTYCGDNLDNCPSTPAPNPCNNDGTCVDLAGDDFRCMCNPGYQGTLCDTDINECDLTPCNNDGTCSNFLGGFSCNCTVGFEGDTCIDRTDYCAMGNACKNGSSCINNRFNYTCECVLGFRGEFCAENIDDCVDVFCGDGICIDGVYGFSCDCTLGYTGPKCEIELDECMTKLSTIIVQFPGSTSVCGTNGVCSDEVNNFTCACGDRYKGTLCREVINCDSKPCNSSNIVECLGGVTDSFECICQPGFTGPLCDINIDECAQFPCHNSAPCTDGSNDYSCDCISPWKGKDCRFQNTSCIPNPCNSGACLDVNLDLSTFNCTCPQGYTGDLCQSDLNECLSGDNTCPSGVNCTNTQGSYYCNCPNAGSGIDTFTCAEIGSFQGLTTADYLYYVLTPSIVFIILALLICLVVCCCCCCFLKRRDSKVAVNEDEHYQSLDVNNYEEITYRLPDEAVTNNPAYITGVGIEKQTDVTAVTFNPHYGGVATEENLYLAEPNQSFSASIPNQPLSSPDVMKSAYNDINDFPTANDIDAPIMGIYNEATAVTSLTFCPGVEENEYGNN